MNTIPEYALDQAARQENFPVASRLLSRRLRGRVVAFYRYARTADDIADDPALGTADKSERLQSLEDGLDGRGRSAVALALREALDGTGVGDASALAAARKLLVAFRRDAGGIACVDWDDLMAYCDASAVPVGRFLLAIHGEAADTHDPSDALCAALQVLNHLQDMAEDHDRLGRRYVPGDWMVQHGATDADLTAPKLSGGLRAAVGRTLDATDALLVRAAPLPGRIQSRGLRAQSAATLALARRLAVRLRRGDPLASRIALTRFDFLRAGLVGLWAAR
ncbi:MAG: squalene/phytoene synthase family protein [Pseudomonadota bacterium]